MNKYNNERITETTKIIILFEEECTLIYDFTVTINVIDTCMTFDNVRFRCVKQI